MKFLIRIGRKNYKLSWSNPRQWKSIEKKITQVFFFFFLRSSLCTYYFFWKKTWRIIKIQTITRKKLTIKKKTEQWADVNVNGTYSLFFFWAKKFFLSFVLARTSNSLSHLHSFVYNAMSSLIHRWLERNKKKRKEKKKKMKLKALNWKNRLVVFSHKTRIFVL